MLSGAPAPRCRRPTRAQAKPQTSRVTRGERHSSALAASQTIEDPVYALFGIRLLYELVVRFARRCDAWHDEVEIEGAYQLQALDVPLPVADPIEHRRPPPAPDEEDRVAGEQYSMLTRIPQ